MTPNEDPNQVPHKAYDKAPDQFLKEAPNHILDHNHCLGNLKFVTNDICTKLKTFF